MGVKRPRPHKRPRPQVHKLQRASQGPGRSLCGHRGPRARSVEAVTCVRCLRILGRHKEANVYQGLPLLEVLRSYPGGLPQLARDSGIAGRTLRRFSRGEQVSVPWDTVRAIVQVGGELAGAPTVGELSLLWKSAREERLRLELA